MFRTGLFLVFVLLLSVACGSTKDTLTSELIIVRTDDNNGAIEVWVDGKKQGSIKPGGKFAYQLPNGRHTVSIKFNKQRSEVIDFVLVNNKQNFRAQGFMNAMPNLTPY